MQIDPSYYSNALDICLRDMIKCRAHIDQLKLVFNKAVRTHATVFGIEAVRDEYNREVHRLDVLQEQYTRIEKVFNDVRRK